MGGYKIPRLKTYNGAKVLEITAPLQTAYTATLDVDGWRGTKLDTPAKYEYRVAGLNSDIKLVITNAKRRVDHA